jgi:hypothetical protein
VGLGSFPLKLTKIFLSKLERKKRGVGTLKLKDFFALYLFT